MADLVAVTKRAQEIVEERFVRWYEDLQEEPDRSEETPQREKRAAYEELREVPGGAFADAVAAFDQRYGAGEFARQLGLGLGRREREE